MELVAPEISKAEAWFDNLIAQLRRDEVQLDTNTADDAKKSFYDTLINGTAEQQALMNKQFAQQTFIPRIIVAFLKEIKDTTPLHLAFDFDDSQVLLWAVIKDDDEEMENRLILAEAKVNAEFHKYGFAMVSTIVEESDRAKTPNHYKIIR